MSAHDLSRCVCLLDSISEIRPAHAGRIVVTGSHGGSSSAECALGINARLYVFNDAGNGKDGAGVCGLELLDAMGQPAAAVSHQSARIGEALESLAHGVISRVNGRAAALGLRVGEPLAWHIERLAQEMKASVAEPVAGAQGCRLMGAKRLFKC